MAESLLVSHADLERQSLIADRFICGDVMVRTGRSVIYQGWDIVDKQPVVLKKAAGELNQRRIDQLQQEGRVLRLNRHQALLSGQGYFFSAGQHWLVMEPACDQLLLDSMVSGDVSRWSSSQKSSLTHSLIRAVRCLHETGWIHGDIKPDNIAINRETDQVLLIDFSAATELTGVRDIQEYSPHWLHPKVLEQSDRRQIDVYGVALIIWSLWRNRHPFDRNGLIDFSQSAACWPVTLDVKTWLNGCWLKTALEKPENLTLDELDRRFAQALLTCQQNLGSDTLSD